MVMDYSERRPGGIRDGNVERKPVQKNRPRKEPMGMLAILSVAVLIATFGAGVFTGWLLFKGKSAPAAAVAAQPAKKEAAPAPPQPAAQPAADPQLTFYQTLPAGGKAAIGSGLNLKKPEASAPAPRPSAPAAAPEAPADEEKEQQSYVVQIASYREKPEADAAQAKLSAKGVAAYVVESRLGDKGTWYRVRVGKHLAKAEADALAAKTGKGAMVVGE